MYEGPWLSLYVLFPDGDMAPSSFRHQKVILLAKLLANYQDVEKLCKEDPPLPPHPPPPIFISPFYLYSFLRTSLRRKLTLPHYNRHIFSVQTYPSIFILYHSKTTVESIHFITHYPFNHPLLLLCHLITTSPPHQLASLIFPYLGNFTLLYLT